MAYRLLLQTENPSWLYAVVNGATTIWERWDSLLQDGSVNPSGMTSFNHYAFGSVADWMHRVLAGLSPAAPGYERIRVAPQPPTRGFTSAAASLVTPYGEAKTAWAIEHGSISITLTVPVGARADVLLPSGQEVFDLGHGHYEWVEPFEVEVIERRAVTVDTRLADIVDDVEAMKVLVGVITKFVPEAAAAVTGGLNGQGDVTPRQIAPMLPHSDDVLADLTRGFEAVSTGLPIPDDVLTAPAPVRSGRRSRSEGRPALGT